MTAQPVAYLVAERRSGQWIIGDDWNRQCDTLDEARKVADEWRSHGRDPADIAVLAVTVVPDGADHAAATEEQMRRLVRRAYESDADSVEIDVDAGLADVVERAQKD